MKGWFSNYETTVLWEGTIAKQFYKKLEHEADIPAGRGGTTTLDIFLKVCSCDPNVVHAFLPVNNSINMHPALHTSETADDPIFLTIYGAIYGILSHFKPESANPDCLFYLKRLSNNSAIP